MKTFEISGVTLRVDECEIDIFVDDRTTHNFQFGEESSVDTVLGMIQDMVDRGEDDSDISLCGDFRGSDLVLVQEDDETFDRAYMFDGDLPTVLEFVEEFFKVQSQGETE